MNFCVSSEVVTRNVYVALTGGITTHPSFFPSVRLWSSSTDMPSSGSMSIPSGEDAVPLVVYTLYLRPAFKADLM